MAYNPFINEDMRDCFFDYEQAVLLRFWTSRTATIKAQANQQARLGLVLEEKKLHLQCQDLTTKKNLGWYSRTN